ncbi:MAG: hypothetical protein U9P14_04455 [Gemmatimonadota bacterium]|nr:hypothetical protein [Gemmatimonadota bacterium]
MKVSVLMKCFIPLAAVLALAGCGRQTPTYFLQLKPSNPEIAVNNVDISFTSYDYHAVLDSLARINNPGPKPDDIEVKTLLSEYRQALSLQTRYADSVSTLNEILAEMDIKSIRYKKLHPIYLKLERALVAASRKQKAVYEKYAVARGTYTTAVREWERKAYEGFKQFKEDLEENSQNRKTNYETTDSDGMVNKVRLSPLYTWFLYTEVSVPGTNEKLIWEMELPKEGPDSLIIILDDNNATRETFFL